VQDEDLFVIVHKQNRYRGTLTVENYPKDAFIDMQEWTKGDVLVNGFALGKPAVIGPQQTQRK
jgi:hypothetical protein